MRKLAGVNVPSKEELLLWQQEAKKHVRMRDSARLVMLVDVVESLWAVAFGLNQRLHYTERQLQSRKPK